MSRLIPNSFQVPNLYVDKLEHLLSPTEFKVLIYAARRIFGWGRVSDRISISQFCDGIESRGTKKDFGTGLSRGAVIAATTALVQFGVMVKVSSPSPSGIEFELQLEEDQIDIAGLEARELSRRRDDLTKTAAARSVRHTDPQSVQQTDSGLSDRPDLVCGTDTHKPSNKPIDETQTPQPAAAGPDWSGYPPLRVSVKGLSRAKALGKHLVACPGCNQTWQVPAGAPACPDPDCGYPIAWDGLPEHNPAGAGKPDQVAQEQDEDVRWFLTEVRRISGYPDLTFNPKKIAAVRQTIPVLTYRNGGFDAVAREEFRKTAQEALGRAQGRGCLDLLVNLVQRGAQPGASRAQGGVQASTDETSKYFGKSIETIIEEARARGLEYIE